MPKAATKKTAKKATKTIGVNLPLETANDIKRRAHSLHLSESRYCRLLLSRWIESGKQLVLEE